MKRDDTDAKVWRQDNEITMVQRHYVSDAIVRIWWGIEAMKMNQSLLND